MKNLFPGILLAAFGLFPQTAAAQGVGLQITQNGIAFATQARDGGQFEFLAGGPVSPARPGGMVLKAIGRDGSGFVFESRGQVRPETQGDIVAPPAPTKAPKTNGRQQAAVRT